MNGNDASNEAKMAEIETRAIADTAARWGVSEELVGGIMQDYTEIIENFEQYLNERYPEEDMNTQPYVAMELSKKVARDIADKHSIDEEVVGMIVQDCAEMIRGSLDREMPDDLEQGDEYQDAPSLSLVALLALMASSAGQ